LRFAWDENKNQTNQRKHGLSFELAARVFLDPGRIERYDDRTPLHEDRWITIGIVGRRSLWRPTHCARKTAR
jgi:hypothetical protein